MHPHPCVSAFKKEHSYGHQSKRTQLDLPWDRVEGVVRCVAVEIELGSRETMGIIFFERLQFGPEHLVFPG